MSSKENYPQKMLPAPSDTSSALNSYNKAKAHYEATKNIIQTDIDLIQMLTDDNWNGLNPIDFDLQQGGIIDLALEHNGTCIPTEEEKNISQSLSFIASEIKRIASHDLQKAKDSLHEAQEHVDTRLLVAQTTQEILYPDDTKKENSKREKYDRIFARSPLEKYSSWLNHADMYGITLDNIHEIHGIWLRDGWKIKGDMTIDQWFAYIQEALEYDAARNPEFLWPKEYEKIYQPSLNTSDTHPENY